ncbi:hypothetical protein CRYUN_Cryun27aG0034200 [Craigia yunnanensis]
MMKNMLWLSILFMFALVLGHVSPLANARSVLKPTTLSFRTLPKNTPLPPPGPGHRINGPPSSPPSRSLSFGILPKNTPIPPSGPSRITSNSPPPPLLNFGMLPKGVPIPPSGPSRRTSSSPPPPLIG